MWLIFFMAAIIIPLIIWGYVAGKIEERTDKKNDKTI